MKRRSGLRKSLRSLSRGFTLVELLVTMALLSLLMLGMASALRTMAQTEERVDARLARADEFRIATGFLRSIVGRISARKNPAPMTQGASPYMFAGAPTTLSWVGIMPARYGAGGAQFLSFSGGTSARITLFGDSVFAVDGQYRFSRLGAGRKPCACIGCDLFCADL